MGRLRQKWPFLTETGCFWGRLRHFGRLRKPLMANAFPSRLIAPERLVERAAGRKGQFCPRRRLFLIAAGRKGLFCPRRRLFPIAAGRKGLFLPAALASSYCGGQEGVVLPAARGNCRER